MTRASVAVIAATILLGAALLAKEPAGAEPSASRVVDRTLLCATSLRGGVYQVEARAGQGIRESARKWKQLPYAIVASGTVGSRATRGDEALASITAGRATAHTTIDTEYRTTPALARGTLALRSSCRASSAKVPLTSKGLTGGPASPFGDEYDCPAPRRVLVRVRAVLRLPAELRSRSGFLSTTSPVQEARLAVRTQPGKPLMYAEVLDTGKARLFVASSCAPG